MLGNSTDMVSIGEKRPSLLSWSQRFGNSCYEIIIGAILICVALTMFDIGKVPSVGVVVLIACSALIYLKIQDFLFRT